MANKGFVEILGDFILQKTVGRSTAELRREARFRLMQAMLMAGVALFGLLTLFWGLLTLYIFLCENMPSHDAALRIAGGLLLVTVFLGLTARFLPHCSKETAAEQKAPQDPTAAIVSEAVRLIAGHPVKASLAALAAGLAVGYSPELREMLLKALDGAKKPEPPEGQL